MPTCFAVMPISTPADVVSRYGGDADHFEHVLEHLFVPAIEAAGYEVIKPAATGSELIQAGIIKHLEEADLVLCDISTLNANVFLELGIRIALDRPAVLVRDDHTPSIPFDMGVINFHTYASALAPWRLNDEIRELTNHITAAAQQTKDHNALWRYFGLTQRGVDATNATPANSEEATLQLVLQELRRLSALVPERENLTERLVSDLMVTLYGLDVQVASIQPHMADDGSLHLRVYVSKMPSRIDRVLVDQWSAKRRVKVEFLRIPAAPEV